MNLITQLLLFQQENPQKIDVDIDEHYRHVIKSFFYANAAEINFMNVTLAIHRKLNPSVNLKDCSKYYEFMYDFFYEYCSEEDTIWTPSHFFTFSQFYRLYKQLIIELL